MNTLIVMTYKGTNKEYLGFKKILLQISIFSYLLMIVFSSPKVGPSSECMLCTGELKMDQIRT